MSKIWVIGGTQDARELVERLEGKGISPLVTVATEYGKSLLSKSISVTARRMDREAMTAFIHENHITQVVDASHPYAREVSYNAIESTALCKISYLRFERERVLTENALHFDSHEEAIHFLKSGFEKILLTTGSNTLPLYSKSIPLQRLVVRVLPKSDILFTCEQLGFSPENIIAMKGPFTKEMNVAMLRQTGAKILVTKDSGEVGGMAEKIEATEETGATLVVVGRPKINYPCVVTSVDEVIERICVE